MSDFCERRECNDTCPLWEIETVCSEVCKELYLNGYDIVKREEEKPKKKTLVVNLIAGSGAGKTKNAWKLGAILKERGIDVELSLEYIKDMVWEGRTAIFDFQSYIFSKQYKKLEILNGQVDVVITDRPIFLDTVYDPDQHEGFRDYVMFKFNSFNNLNIFINRGDKFNPNGRNENTIEEARANDEKIKVMLDNLNVPYIEANDSEIGCLKMLEAIISKLEGEETNE